MDGYVTARQAAEMLGVSQDSIRRNTKLGELKGLYCEDTHTKNRYFYREEDVLEFGKRYDFRNKIMTEIDIAKVLRCNRSYVHSLVKQGYIQVIPTMNDDHSPLRESAERFLDEITLRGDWRTGSYLTAIEAAKVLFVSHPTVFNYVKDGRLQAGMILPNGRMRFLEDDINDFCSRRNNYLSRSS